MDDEQQDILQQLVWIDLDQQGWYQYKLCKLFS
jgi:hypothetical protein